MNVVRALRQAVHDRDWQRACERLTGSAQSHVGVAAHGALENCPLDLYQIISAIERSDRGMTQALRLSSVQIDGDRASVRVSSDRGSASVPLVETGGWRVDSFLGSSPDEAIRHARDGSKAPFPAAEVTPVTAAHRDGGRCLDFASNGYFQLTSDCRLRAQGTVTISIVSAFGAFEFGDCVLVYEAWVDGGGRTASDGVSFASKGNSGCADIHRCQDGKGVVLPWKGRISGAAGGSLIHQIDVCLNTCIGYYVGELKLTLMRSGTRVRMTADESAVGGSGLHLSGELDVHLGAQLRPNGG